MDDEARALEAQAEAVLDLLRAAAVRLLFDGGVRPQLVALAVARVAGELGASIAVADGLALDRVLGDLADFTHRAGREHHGLVSPADPARVLRLFPSAAARREGHQR